MAVLPHHADDLEAGGTDTVLPDFFAHLGRGQRLVRRGEQVISFERPYPSALRTLRPRTASGGGRKDARQPSGEDEETEDEGEGGKSLPVWPKRGGPSTNWPRGRRTSLLDFSELESYR